MRYGYGHINYKSENELDRKLMMLISRAAKLTGLPEKTIRYYEAIGLVVADRQKNGYRSFDDVHLHKLCFIQRARNLGFTIKECRQLLAPYENKERSDAHVKILVKSRLEEIEQRIDELQRIHEELLLLVKSHKGNSLPGFPILVDLAYKDIKQAH